MCTQVRVLRVLPFVLRTKLSFINFEQKWIFDKLVRQVMESCTLLGYYAVRSGNSLQSFRAKLSFSPRRRIRYVGPKRR